METSSENGWLIVFAVCATLLARTSLKNILEIITDTAIWLHVCEIQPILTGRGTFGKGKLIMKQTIYYGGDILTMEEPITVEAILVKDGIIAQAGSLRDILAQKEEETVLEHLHGKTLLPAFLDPHSHITALASTMGLAPLDGADSFDDIVSRLEDFRKKQTISSGQWLTGFGYDHNFLKEKAHPTKEVLDRAFPDTPVLITHASGHMGVVNSAALAALGVTSRTPDPEGGKIGRMDGTMEPNGYLEETAFTALSSKLPQPTMEQLLDQLDAAQKVYLQNGITTVQDGFTRPGEWTMLKAMTKAKRFLVDVVGYVALTDHRSLRTENTAYCKEYQNRLRIGGYKMFLDGSPQGKTAWLSEPYASSSDGYRGYPIYTDEQVYTLICQALQDGVQLLTHCNGDAAAQQLIDGFERALSSFPNAPSTRPVMIHAQTVRPDQLQRMAPLSMIASFFVAHTHYWGDVHLKNLGLKRANRISPARTAGKLGVTYTFHQDTPVLPPNMIDTVWCAVNRVTKSGVTLGECERVTPLAALKAVTINAAYQYFEEGRKGSIHEGKLADLVILDRNPLTVDPMDIRKIRVIKTIKEGETVYSAEEGARPWP